MGWNTVEIMQIDLRTAEASTSTTTRVIRYNAFWDPCVCGDFVVLALSGGVLLVNWSEQTVLLLALPRAHVVMHSLISKSSTDRSQRPDVGLLPGYLILTARDAEPPHKEKIIIYSVAALAAFLKPISDLDFMDPLPIAALSPVLVQFPALGDYLFRDVQDTSMAIHASPLRRNAYQVSFYVWDYPSGRRGAFIRYMCTVPDTPGEELQWKLISTRSAPPGMQYHGLTYAGHALDGLKHDVHYSLQVPAEGPNNAPTVGLLLPADRECVATNVSSYGCAVASLTLSSLRVCYYE